MLVNTSPGPYRASREYPRDHGIRACGAALLCPPAARSRGGPLSSAILYLAIVVIWLGALVPRWLRPRQVIVRATEPRRREDNPWQDSDSDTEPIPRVSPEHDHLALRPGPSPAARRGAILRARRRMLAMTTFLAAAAMVIAVAHLAAWWVVVPPMMMFGGFVMLLREAARTDADRARRLAAHAGSVRQSAADSVVATETVRAPVQAPKPAWTAEIIDISARLGDQLYDQYADAAVRAVGD